MDYIYVQGVPFHHSMSRSYKFRTIESLRGKSKPNNNDIKVQSKRTINVYHAQEISISQLNVDNDFEVLGEELRPIPVNMVGAGEHVGDIERSGRTIKEHTRFHVHRLSYKRHSI